MSGVALTGYVYQPPTAQARADLLLGSPRGRLLLAGCLGYAFSDALREQRDVTPPQVRVIADRLGRWYGDPQGTGTWDDLAEAFIPDDQ